MKAWDLIGFPDCPRPGTLAYDTDYSSSFVRIKGGRTLYEGVSFEDDGRQEKVHLWRLDSSKGALRQVKRPVDPDTEVEIVNAP